MKVKVYGASDDLIELDGDLREELNPHRHADDDFAYLAFGDGTVLSVTYAKDGCWRVKRVCVGAAHYEKKEAEGADTDSYSDIVTLDGDLKYCVFGDQIVRK